jgi:hypothetical protein
LIAASCGLFELLCEKKEYRVSSLIDVLDTAVKIGLGATISALATYWHSKYKSKSESAKEYEKRHRTLLEQVAVEVEQLNHVYLKYWALITESVRVELKNNKWPGERREELEQITAELFTAFGAITSAESKLLLIGENEAYSKLRELGESVVLFRRTCYVDKKGLTLAELDSKKMEIKLLREQLYAMLSGTYQTNFT